MPWVGYHIYYDENLVQLQGLRLLNAPFQQPEVQLHVVADAS